MQNDNQFENLLRFDNIDQTVPTTFSSSPSAAIPDLLTIQQQQPLAESCDESEDEWNYMRLKEGQGEKQKIDNLTKSSDQFELQKEVDKQSTEVIEEKIVVTEITSQEANIDFLKEEKGITCPLPNLNFNTDLDDDMNYPLNPEAKEFVPLSPTFEQTKVIGGDNESILTKLTQQQRLANDDVVAQSPRKGIVINMDEITIPDENVFDYEADNRPHDIIDSPQQQISDTTETIVDTNTVMPQDLYQELNLKEAMHGSEKEEHLADANQANYNPLAEFENCDMKESIYIKNLISNEDNEQFGLNETNEILNQIQILPDYIDSVTKDDLLESISKGNILSDQNERNIVSPTNELNNIVQVSLNGLSSEENNLPEIIKDLNVLNLSNNTENDNTKLSSVAAVTVIGAVVAIEKIKNKNSENDNKTKELEKNSKNKMNSVKVPSKVSEKKLPITKTISSTQALPPKKISSTTTSTTTSKVSSKTTSKPKTLTVNVSAPAPPKTLTFPRPRSSPASAPGLTSTGSKTIVDKKPSATLITNKIRTESARPATLPVKKPSSNTTTTTETKTNTVKTTITKSGLAAKPLVSQQTSNSNVNKVRPASATSVTNGTTASNKSLQINQRPTLAAKSAPIKPTSSLSSPRGTHTSALRKTEAIKSPIKTTTTSTITSRVNGSRVIGSTGLTTKPITTTTTRTSASTLRKSTKGPASLLPGKPSAATIAANEKKPIPIKRPIKKDVEKVVVSKTNSTTSFNEPTKLNGVEKIVGGDITTA